MKKYLFIKFSVALIFLLSSCIAFKYRSEREVHGIEDNLSYSNNNSVEKANIIMIHGIGRTDQDYSKKMIKSISKNILGKNYECETYEYERFDGKLVKIKNFSSKRELVFYSVWWSPLTEPLKDSIIKTERKNNPTARRFSFLPYLLKTQVMTDRAGDAFFAQQEDVMSTIVEMIDSTVVDIQKHREKLNSLNLISASLGSQVFTRYLINNKDRFTEETIDSSLSKRHKLISEFSQSFVKSVNDDTLTKMTLNFYLLSNQLMLMNESVNYWGGCDLIGDSTDMDNLRFDNLNYYAFRNPNDFLNYYLENEAITKQFKADSINVVNSWYYNLALRPGAFVTRNGSIISHILPYRLKKMSKIISYGTYKKDSGKKLFYSKNIKQ